MLLLAMLGSPALAELPTTEVLMLTPLSDSAQKEVRKRIARPAAVLTDAEADHGLAAVTDQPLACMAELGPDQRDALRTLSEQRQSELYVTTPSEGGVLIWRWMPETTELIRINGGHRPAGVDRAASVVVVPWPESTRSSDAVLPKRQLARLSRTEPLVVVGNDLSPDLLTALMAGPAMCVPDLSTALVEEMTDQANRHAGELYLAVEEPGQKDVLLYVWQPNAARLVAIGG